MTVYVISFALNMLFGLSLCIKGNGNYNANELNVNMVKRRLYLLVTAVQLGLICGFRSTEMAYDTNAYKLLFDLCPDNWKNIFEESSYVEVGFRVLCSIIKIYGGDYQTMLIITSLFVMGSCCIFIYRHSKDVVLSVFIIISFPFFYSSFDIIRHFLATAFLLLGYKYVVERKPIRFLLFIFIGSLFHSIAWLFLPFYFLRKLKWNRISAGITAIVTVILYIYIAPVADWISSMMDKGVESGWIDSFGGGIKTAIMYGVVLLIAIAAYLLLKDKNEDDASALSYVVLMFVFSILFINARMMTRMIMTEVALIAIAIPQLLDKARTSSHRDHLILKLGFIAIGFIYHAFLLLSNWQNVIPYIPYWS